MDNILKIQRISTWMQHCCSVVLVAWPLLLALIWLDFERFGRAIGQTSGLPIQMENIGPLNLVLGYLCSMIAPGLVLYGVWRLRSVFSAFSKRVFFTEENSSHLHTFATMLFISALANPIAGVLLSLVLTMNNPAGQRSINLSVGSQQLSTLFIAGAFMIVAWIMRESQRIEAENKEFV